MYRIKYSHVMCIVLFVYTMMPLFSVSMGLPLMLGAIMTQSVIFGITWYCAGFVLKKPRGFLEVILYALGIFALLGILLYCMGIDIGYMQGYDTELYLLWCVLIYMTVAHRPLIERYYFDTVLIGIVILMLCYLIYALVWPEMGSFVGGYVRDKKSVAITAMLSLVISDIRYSTTRKHYPGLVYGTVAFVSGLVLAMNAERMSIYMMSGILLLIPVYSAVDREVLKRQLSVFGGFVFLLCNMSLLVQCTNVIQIECNIYSLEASVVGELVLCVFLCYVMQLWDKLPEDDPQREIQILQRVQRNLRRLLVIALCVILGMLLNIPILDNLPDGMMMHTVKTEIGAVYQEILRLGECNVLYLAIRNYDFWGIVIVMLVWCGISTRISKKYKPMLSGRMILRTIIILSVILMGVWAEKRTAYGIYIWFMAYALLPSLTFKGKRNK